MAQIFREFPNFKSTSMETNKPSKSKPEGDSRGERLAKAVSQMMPYLKHRLYRAETEGFLPKNMYKVQGIADEALARILEKSYHSEIDDTQLRFTLFTEINTYFYELQKQESFHKDSLSTEELLEMELKQLQEPFYMDANEDLITQDELDDISYHQPGSVKTSFVYEEESRILQSLGVYERQSPDLDQSDKNKIHRLYNWLPWYTATILDLYIFGGLTVEDIAKIQGTDAKRVDRVLQEVRKRFRRNLE